MEREHREEISCRICLKNSLNNEKLVSLNEFSEEVLNILLFKLDLNGESSHLICSDCSRKIFAAFNFKMECLCIEDVIAPYIKPTGILLDLREVYMKEKEQKRMPFISDELLKDQKFCRLCMQLCLEFVSFEDTELAVIYRYIPEINFSSTEDPVLCQSCFYSVITHSTFIDSCLKLQEKHKNVHGGAIEGCGESYVKEEDVDLKLEEDDHISNIPTKETANDRKMDCDLDVEDIITKHVIAAADEPHILRHEYADTYVSHAQMYECCQCGFNTKYKKSIRSHLLTHKEEVQKCYLCGYETPYKLTFRIHMSRHKQALDIQKYEELLE